MPREGPATRTPSRKLRTPRYDHGWCNAVDSNVAMGTRRSTELFRIATFEVDARRLLLLAALVILERAFDHRPPPPLGHLQRVVRIFLAFRRQDVHCVRGRHVRGEALLVLHLVDREL